MWEKGGFSQISRGFIIFVAATSVVSNVPSHKWFWSDSCTIIFVITSWNYFSLKESQKGNRIKPKIANTINITSIHIAIFSTSYAESEWCMDDLALMAQSESNIILVFYNVKRKDVWWNRVHGMNRVYVESMCILKVEKIFDPINSSTEASIWLPHYWNMERDYDESYKERQLYY